MEICYDTLESPQNNKDITKAKGEPVPIPEGVPEAAIKEAVEAGKIILEADNYCYMGGNVYDWKEENGAFLYDTK